MIEKYIRKLIDKIKLEIAGDSQPIGPIEHVIEVPSIDPYNPIPVPKPVKPRLEDR